VTVLAVADADTDRTGDQVEPALLDQRTSCVVNADPPSAPGVHDTVVAPAPDVAADTAVAAAGTVGPTGPALTVTGGDEALHAPVPNVFDARTRNTYDAPFTRPVARYVTADAATVRVVHVAPPLRDQASCCPVTADPPSDPGVHDTSTAPLPAGTPDTFDGADGTLVTTTGADGTDPGLDPIRFDANTRNTYDEPPVRPRTVNRVAVRPTATEADHDTPPSEDHATCWLVIRAPPFAPGVHDSATLPRPAAVPTTFDGADGAVTAAGSNPCFAAGVLAAAGAVTAAGVFTEAGVGVADAGDTADPSTATPMQNADPAATNRADDHRENTERLNATPPPRSSRRTRTQPGHHARTWNRREPTTSTANRRAPRHIPRDPTTNNT
jgi:hypothetical protein